MSKRLLNDKYCVRCSRNEATPYLSKNIDRLEAHLMDVRGVKLAKTVRRGCTALDIGCGNGRNTEMLWDRGWRKVYPIDMVGDFGLKVDIGVDGLPFADDSVHLILANYVLMFLTQEERSLVIEEIKRVAAPQAAIIVEVYAAKDAYDCDAHRVFDALGWRKVLLAKERFIAVNG